MTYPHSQTHFSLNPLIWQANGTNSYSENCRLAQIPNTTRSVTASPNHVTA